MKANEQVIAAGLASPEGPTLGPDGWLLNVCSIDRPDRDWPTRGGDVTITHPDNPLRTSVLLNTSSAETKGIPAALAFGPDDALYIADEGRRAILRATPDGEVSEFITHYNGTRINGPNDLSFAPSGDLYFTDPWTSSPANPVGAVYRLDWNTGRLHLIDSAMEFSNGIVASATDLYVAETFPRKIWRYIEGEPDSKRLFCELPAVTNPPPLAPDVASSLGVDHVVGPDGMAFDVEGRLWVAHFGAAAVLVYSPEGKLEEILPTPGTTPTNLCFGESDLSSLWISVDDIGAVISVPSGTTGRQLSFCPSASTNHPWLKPIEARFDRSHLHLGEAAR